MTPRDYGGKLVEAYGHDIVTGRAPGLTLQDVAETVIQEAVGEARAEVDRLKALVAKYESLIERIEISSDEWALDPGLAMQAIEDEIEAFTADLNKGATE